MPLLLFLPLLWSGLLFSDTLALYLSWYGDPSTTMAIQWHTPAKEDTDEISLEALGGGEWVSFFGSHLELEERIVHAVFLEKLAADTEYSFRIPSDPAIYKFRTAPQDLKRPLRFVIGGDLYQSKKLFREMNAAIVRKTPLFAVLGGDIAYAISRNPFQFPSTERNQWFSFLQEWKEQMILPDGQVIPFLLVPGNHDITPDHYDLFFKLFAFPKKQLYRAIDFGQYLSLILLDTGHFQDIEGAQTSWLQDALLKRSNVFYRIPIYHIAAYPSYYSFSQSTPKKIRENWCPLFDQHHLPAVFENHNHAFKRTHPIRAGKIDENGVVYLGDGCWGTEPRSTQQKWYLAKQAPKNNVYMVELTAQSATIEAMDSSAAPIDRLEILSFDASSEAPSPLINPSGGALNPPHAREKEAYLYP